MNATVYYHAPCLDGFGAAYAAWRHLQGDALYRGISHGEPWQPEEVADRDVFILDFSFPEAELSAMAQVARSVVLLDHHVSAMRPWAGRLVTGEDGLARYRHPTLPLTVAFDLEKSGTRLAWEHFQQGQPLPLALGHIEDQDLWRFQYQGTRAFCRALRQRPFEFSAWDEVIREAYGETAVLYRAMLAQGEAIEQFCRQEVQGLADSSLVMPAILRGEPVDPLQAIRHGLPVTVEEGATYRRVDGLAINANSLFASELGQVLAERSGSFGLIWQMNGDGLVKVSLRAAGKVNVALLAERYGGGGHPNAAGFRLPARQFFPEVLGLGA